jgi:alkylresorcinol/alkylpyrone synthase
MPLEWYREPHDFGERNRLYIEHGLTLARPACEAALERAGLAPADIDHVVFVSSTGLATPSLDARLAQILGLREDVHRTPIWGLGCAGGAVGVARARDFALADSGARVLLVALELCTLSFQRRDLDRRSLVAAALFSDGAAAAVVSGPEAVVSGVPSLGVTAAEARNRQARALELLASQSTLWPDSLDVMGWDVDGEGLHVVFSRDIPSIVTERVRPNLEGFLATQGLSLQDVRHLVAHPGGPRVLEAYGTALGVPPEAFVHAREVLRTCGNMSSPTCLFVLQRLLEHGVEPGDTAVLAALGPGFASEYVLMRAVA